MEEKLTRLIHEIRASFGHLNEEFLKLAEMIMFLKVKEIPQNCWRVLLKYDSDYLCIALDISG